MELLTPHGWPIFLLDCIRDGYPVLTVICLFLRLLRSRNISRQAVNVQFAANFLLAIGIVLDIIVWGELYYDAYIGGNAVFSTPEAYQYHAILIACIILYWILGLLFFIRRLRLSWLLSLLVLLLMNANYIIPIFIPAGRDMSNDWTTSRIEMLISHALIFCILTAMVYFIYYKRKKLPYN